MDELVTVAVAQFEGEAVALRDLLKSAGIEAIYRATNQGAAALDGLVTGAPQEILVRAEDAELAKEVLESQ
jgi:Putative prokaryotic signal transducing protein